MKSTRKIAGSITATAMKITAALAISFSFTTGAVFANETRDTIYFTLPPSPEVLASHLFSEVEKKPLTRSISFKKPSQSNTPVADVKSVAMPVLFHFGKTTITDESIQYLDNVGKMLMSESYTERQLVVEGHTDAVGPTGYNQRLSELRALAIKDYLVEYHGVEPQRLKPVGKGEAALYNTINPNSRENRRVEFMPYNGS